MVEYERNPDQESTPGQTPKICVVGLGGGGLNVLDRICLDRLMEGTLVSMHTDVRVLSHSMGPVKIQLGAEMMRGIGCGGDPELGREAANASREQIKNALNGHEMVFICTGLGGGTGSGAAPVVAEIAKELGALVFVFATTPFSFEGRRRLTQAEVALELLQPFADALILFENNRMGELVLPKEGIQKAFSQADQLIGHSVRAISTMVNQPGIIRVSLADLTTALRSPNARCLFGFGEARGSNRVTDVLKRALKSPLVNQGLLLQKAENLIVHIAGGDSITLAEVDQLMKQLGKYVPEDTQIMFGVTVEPKLADLLTVTLMSSLSVTDMALESSSRLGSTERIPARPAAPARPVAPPSPVDPLRAAEPVRTAEPVRAKEPPRPVTKPVEAEAEHHGLHISVGGNGKHTAAPPVAAPIEVHPEFPAMEIAPTPLRSEAPPVQEPVAAEAAAVEPEVVEAEAPPVPSSADQWFAPVEPPAPPVAEPEPLRAGAPISEEPPAPEPVVAPQPPKIAARPTPARHIPSPPKPAPVSAQPASIVKASIFSVIEEDDEEEEDTGTKWAEKYIQPKQPQLASSQIERREPARASEPALAGVGAAPAKSAGAAQKQPSLNLHPDNVGRFKGTDKTIVEGEDLDVPTWMRMRGKVGK